MDTIFLHLLNMSLSAAVLVVVVVLLRLVFYKAPRWIHCLLWALVAVRLLCPFTIESDVSLMPDTSAVLAPLTPDSSTVETIIPDDPMADSTVPDTPPVSTPPQTSVGGTVSTLVVPSVPDTSAPTLPDSSVADPSASVDPWQIALAVATLVWLLGMLAMLAYAIVTTIRLRLQVREAAHLEGNLWQCDHIRTPFILGVLHPRIYLPSDLDATAQQSVVAHERAHLRCLDHWWKPFGFLLLTVYWFNPLVWVAYILLCRDIEAACDERVVRDMSVADRKAYSEALLSCSAPRRLISACPLAFGETSVKSRIKSVLSYKKPTIWIIVAALLVSTVAGVCLLTDPKSDEPDTSISDDTPDVPPTHAVFTHTGEPKAQVTLELNGNGCTYINSILSSAMPYEGTYVKTENNVILSFPDDSMTIQFAGDFTGLTLCIGQSDTRMNLEQLSYGGKELKNGAVFARTVDASDVSYTAPLTFSAGNWLGNEQLAEMRQKYQYRTGNYSDQDWPIIPITSRDELDAFVATYENETSHFDFATADMSAYDDAFFADKMLLAVYYRDGSSSVNPKIAAVEYNGAELVTVQVNVYEPSIQNAMLGQWFMLAEIPRSDVKCATAYRAVVRDRIPTNNCWATYSHPVTVGGTDKPAIGYYSIFSYGRETLAPLVERLTWQETDATFAAIGHFSFDGETCYYVDTNLTALYDGKRIAYLTAEDASHLNFYLRDGNPGEKAAAASLVGKMVEWSKEGHYMLLEITEGDPKLGERVKVSTRIMPPGSAPEKDASVTVFYDGYYEAGYIPTIYALYRTTGGYADLVGGPDDPGPVLDENTFVGKVVQVSDGRMLMQCYETEKFTTVWVSLANYPAIRPQVGEEYVITHSGMVEITLPPCVTAELITPVSSTPPTTGTTTTTPPTTGTTTTPTKPTAPTASTKPSISPTAKVTFVKFSRPADGPESYFSYAQYMYPVQPDAATCAWLRQLASKTNWVARDTWSGSYDAYFTIGDDENYYYIDRVNQRLFHNRRFVSLTKEETSKLDTFIRSYGIQPNAPMTGKPADWSYLIGRVQEFVDGENGYVLLKVNYQGANLYGDVVKVSTRFIPRQFFATGRTVCVVYDGEPDVETTPFTIYAAAMNELKENDIISTGVPLYDDLLRQIQTYYYNRSATKPDCSSMVWSADSLLETGVRLVDLDKDGQDELVLDAAYDMFWMGSYDVYTIKNGKLVHLFSSTPDVRYSLCKNGYVCKEWMKNVSNFGEEYYRIEGDTLTYVEGVVFDTRYNSSLGVSETDAWYRVTIVDGEKHYESITLEDAEQITQKYGKDDVTHNIKVIPFSL